MEMVKQPFLMYMKIGKHPITWQFFVTILGWLSDPFKWLGDLQLGDEKVTLNHLVNNDL